MTSVDTIEIALIDISSRIRSIDPAQVEALKDSIAEVGLLNPVTVCPNEGGGYRLVAGGHRLAAAKELGLVDVPARIVTLGEYELVIAECDENLCGPRLSPAEKALFTAKRKEAYEALHPETGHGGDRKSDQAANFATRSFADDQSEKTGAAARTVRLDAERGEKVIPEVLAMIKGTKLDTGVYLDKLKKLPPNEQVAAAKRDLAASKRADAAEKKAGKGVDAASTPPSHAAEPPEQEFNPLAVRVFTPAPDYGGLTADQRIAELEEHVRVLETEYAELMAETKKYREMKVLFEKGGFEEVIAAKEEVIRGLETRLYSESDAKASWMRKAAFWEKQAKNLGWRDTRRDSAPAEVPADYDDAFYAAINEAEGRQS